MGEITIRQPQDRTYEFAASLSEVLQNGSLIFSFMQ
jgi:hypothetical protein